MADSIGSKGSDNRHLVQYYDELVHYINFKITDRQMAKDVVQETYLRIFQRPDQFVGLIHPIAFLKRVSINIAFDFLKRDKIYNKFFEILKYQQIDFIENTSRFKAVSSQELTIMRAQYSALILKKISVLSPVCQDIFLLIQFYGMTQVEVAQQLGISRKIVIKHFMHALQHFSQLFDDEQNKNEIKKS